MEPSLSVHRAWALHHQPGQLQLTREGRLLGKAASSQALYLIGARKEDEARNSS